MKETTDFEESLISGLMSGTLSRADVRTKLTKKICETNGVDPEIMEYLASFEFPEKLEASAFGLSVKELFFDGLCHAFYKAKQDGYFVIAEQLANTIGREIAALLMQSDYGTLRIISEGMMNLQSGKDFVSHSGRKLSVGDRFKVIIALYHLRETGNAKPSQSELLAALGGSGKKWSKERLSKIIDALGLKSELSDARQAQSEAGRRRRKK